jgi:hypothetical protein
MGGRLRPKPRRSGRGAPRKLSDARRRCGAANGNPPVCRRAAAGRRAHGRPRSAPLARCRAALMGSARNRPPSNIAPLCRRAASRGGNFCRFAMAPHSSRSAVARSAAPAATMSPMGARIRQAIPAAVAIKTHFSHISCRMAMLRRASNLAPLKADPIAKTRSDADPSRSPNDKTWVSFRCSTVPVQHGRDQTLAAKHGRCAKAFLQELEMAQSVEPAAGLSFWHRPPMRTSPSRPQDHRPCS